MSSAGVPGAKPDGGVRVAISTDGQDVAPHFGRCESYTIADVSDGKVFGQTVISNPGHEPGRLPRMLAGLDVDWIVAGGMGRRAEALFAEAGIRTVVGVQGAVREALEDFASGRLTPGESLCEHYTGGQQRGRTE